MDEKIVNELILQVYDLNIGEKTTISELLSKTHYKVMIKDLPELMNLFLIECEKRNIELDFGDNKNIKTKMNYSFPFVKKKIII